MENTNKQEEIQFFGYYRSSASFRLRIAMSLKKMDYKYCPVNLLKGEHREEEYTKINPQKLGIIFKLVPSLVIDGDILIESLPIIEYLDETRPDKDLPLYGKNPIERAKIRAVCEMVNAGIQPLGNMRTINKIADDFQGDKMAWINYWFTIGFQAIENYLEDKCGKYCFGDSITAADIVLFPQLFLGKNRFNVDISGFKNLTKIFENLSQVPEFDKAQPKYQPDFVA